MRILALVKASTLLAWGCDPAGPAPETAPWDTIARGRLRYTPTPVPGELKDSLAAGRIRVARFSGVGEGEMADIMDAAIELPPFRPPLRSTFLARDGTLWIELATASRDSAEGILVDPDLTPRGAAHPALGMEAEYGDGTTVWAVETDQVDVPWLVRLRVEG